jgi:hypothetical protein
MRCVLWEAARPDESSFYAIDAMLVQFATRYSPFTTYEKCALAVGLAPRLAATLRT